MEYAITLLQRLGLYAPKPTQHEAFDLRLTRITTREARCNRRTQVFVRPAL